jgi:hypothetical protein
MPAKKEGEGEGEGAKPPPPTQINKMKFNGPPLIKKDRRQSSSRYGTRGSTVRNNYQLFCKFCDEHVPERIGNIRKVIYSRQYSITVLI